MSYWTNFAASAAGPALACIVTNPADVAKTRLNLELELEKAAMSRTTGSFSMMRKTLAAEGFSGLQRGLPLAMAREATKPLARASACAFIRRVLYKSFSPIARFQHLIASLFN